MWLKTLKKNGTSGGNLKDYLVNLIHRENQIPFHWFFLLQMWLVIYILAMHSQQLYKIRQFVGNEYFHTSIYALQEEEKNQWKIHINGLANNHYTKKFIGLAIAVK